MKKVLFGIAIGFMLSLAVAAQASPSIQASIYAVKLLIHGQEQPPDEGLQILNYGGNAYVPIRYLAERMNGKITFDETTQTINMTASSIEPLPLRGYTRENAIQNGDIVIQSPDRIANREKAEAFFEHYSKQQPDWIRITFFTVEGDPVIHEVLYDGRMLWYLQDYSRDAYGVRGRNLDQCTDVQPDQQEPVYWITGCSQTPDFSIPELRMKQDQ